MSQFALLTLSLLFQVDTIFPYLIMLYLLLLTLHLYIQLVRDFQKLNKMFNCKSATVHNAIY